MALQVRCRLSTMASYSPSISTSSRKMPATRYSATTKIFASNDLDQPQDFIPVINAIQGDGFNPLWHQILIVFNEGFTPHQFMSDDEVEAAATGTNPEITLVDTGEVYRCSVVGNK